MHNYKISVSKDGKKYNIVFKAENEAVARNRVHREWYSILSVEEIFDKWDIWNTFIFEWYKDNEFKHWKIVWNDIFKAYVKLRKNLEYSIDLIYSESDENKSLEQKKKIVKELEEEYDLYYSHWKKEKIDELRDKIKKERDWNKKLESFYLKKELEETNKLIELVLKKLEKITSWNYLIEIDNETRDKLKNVYNEIIKLKKSTNIAKLKEVWELALVKIGSIELKHLEKTKNKENRELLKETNKLLKKLWSKDQFIEKEKDIVYQLKNFNENINNFFKSLKKEKKDDWIDRHSHTYIKSLLYLSKYKERLKQNNKFILVNIFKLAFNKELREETFLKRVVIKQNIALLKAREKWISFSYTYIKKWLKTILNEILFFFKWLRDYIFFIIFIYTLFFIIYLNISQIFNVKDYDFWGIFYFLVIIISYLLLKVSKNIFLLLISFVFLFFIVIFGVINF